MKIKEKIAMWALKSITPGRLLPDYKNNQPIWTDWSTENAVKEGMKASTYVYACVDRIAKAAASVPWKVYKKDSKGNWKEIVDHPLEKLLDKPNPFMSRGSLIYRYVSHLYLGGNALLTKVRVRNIPVELWPVGPDGFLPVPNQQEFISHYQYERDGKKIRIEPQDIIHTMFIDPCNPYWGLSPLQAGAKTVDTDIEAVKWNKVALQNRAVTDGVFSFDTSLTMEQWKEARQQVKEQHQGADNARAPWVLGSGAKWHQMSLSPAEMDFINSRKMTREEICSIFNVPPPMVGIYDNATLANMESSRRIFWLDTIIPLLDVLQESFNLTLTHEFGQDIWLGYDTSNVQALQENFKEKVENAKSLFNMGVPFNDINQKLELGFDDVPGGNIGYLPMSLLPANMSSERFDDEEEEESKGLEFKYFNLDSEEKKTMHWKRVDTRRRRWESKVADIVQKQFLKEAKYVADNLDDIDKAIDSQLEAWKKTYQAFYIAVMEDFGEDTGNSLTKAFNPLSERKFAFDPYTDGVRMWISATIGKRITNVTDATKRLVKIAVAQGTEEGETSVEIARRVKQAYNDFSFRRAVTIARTEVGSAMNAGSHFAAEQTGLDYERKWLSSRDDRVRDDHDVYDGETVSESEPFNINGSEMMFPGDSSLGADGDQVINCRCVETYEIRR